MKNTKIELNSADNHKIFVRLWEPQTVACKAVLQISHGMAEHSLRYQEVARQLTLKGYAVVAHDHRGHGFSAWGGQNLGHYSDRKGWYHVVNDLNLVGRFIEERFPNVPRFILGHSMGSFILTQYLIEYQPTVEGILFSGSNYSPPLKYRVARNIALAERIRQGKRGRSLLMDFISFGSYNKAFTPTLTEFDWLSRDPDDVKKYINDPYCGFKCTNQLWMDLLDGLTSISKVKNLRKIPPSTPFYIFSGDKDPVGGHGKGVTKLVRMLKKAGIQNVDSKLYPEGRHEMLNETNRQEVVSDMLGWLESRTA